MTQQPQWELVYATDYSALYRDATGVYAPELSIAQEIDGYQLPEDIEQVTHAVYRVVLDRLKVSDPTGALRAIADDAISMGDLDGAAKIEAEIWAAPHHLISLAWDPSWNETAPPSGRDEWFIDSLDSVALFAESSRDDLERALCSDDPGTLAQVYEAIGGYHGFANLDEIVVVGWTANEFKEWPKRGQRLDTDERDTFTEGYVSCALWADVMIYKHDDDCPCHEASENGDAYEAEMDHSSDAFDESDLTPDALAALTSDAHDFYAANVADIRTSTLGAERCGHDFWLTRNGHGAGFWDHGHISDEADAALSRLDKASRPYGEQSLVQNTNMKVELL